MFRRLSFRSVYFRMWTCTTLFMWCRMVQDAEQKHLDKTCPFCRFVIEERKLWACDTSMPGNVIVTGNLMSGYHSSSSYDSSRSFVGCSASPGSNVFTHAETTCSTDMMEEWRATMRARRRYVCMWYLHATHLLQMPFDKIVR